MRHLATFAAKFVAQLVTGSLLALMLAAGATAQESEQGIRPGDSWTAPDGTVRQPVIKVEIIDWRYIRWDVRQDTYRRIKIDQRRSTPRNGYYAMRAVRNGYEGKLTLDLEADTEGRVTECQIRKFSNYDDFDFNACDYVTRNIRFVPQLDERGEREATGFVFRISYALDGSASPGAPKWPPPEQSYHIPPRPLEPVTLESLGIDPDIELPHEVEAFAVGVKVKSDGTPAYCMMTVPTDIDALDTHICDTLLRDFTFEAGRDRETGEAVWTDYHVQVMWDE